MKCKQCKYEFCLPTGFNTCDEIRLPQICAVWKSRKKKPNNLVMMTSADSPLLLPSLTPIVVTQAHFEDHNGAAHVPTREKQQAVWEFAYFSLLFYVVCK